MSGTGPHFPVERLETWLGGRGLADGPVTVRPIGEGLSNFTYAASSGSGTVVVRHGPPSRSGSNDVRREARFLAAAAGAVPVPRVLAVAGPGEVMDVACYVMEHLDGEVVTDSLPAALDTPDEHRRIAEALVDVLAALHAADWSTLADIARPDGYLERQLDRVPRIIADADGTVPEPFSTLGDQLRRTIPTTQGPPALLHGDLRLGNVMLSRTAPAAILGVLDWELAAVGDPLADVGYTLATYAVPGEVPHALTELSAPTLGAGFPSRAALAERYARATGRDLSRLGWYQALALWKLAVMFEFSRRRHAAGDGDPYYARPGLVDGLVEAARHQLSGEHGDPPGHRGAPPEGPARRAQPEESAMTAPVLTDIETFAFWERDRAERMAAFAWLREHDPVSWHPPAESLLLPPELNVNGFWALTTHAHIQEASRSPAFCSGQGIFMEDMPEIVLAASMSFLAMDPPGHGELRGIVQKAFSPPRIRRMEDWIRSHARDVVAQMAPAGEGDLVKSLGKRLPGLIYSHYIGVDEPELRDRVVRAADQLGSWNDPEYTATMEPLEVFANAAEILSDVALELAELRRTAPGDDMVTWLVETEFEGRQLEDWEIASFFVMLSGAANDTSGHVIAYSLLELDRHPEQKAWLLEDFEGRIDSAVEELMRWRPPLLHFRRTAVEDYEMGGSKIRAGDKVVLWYVSGNFDGDQFTDPDRLDLSRAPNRHLAFGGGGIHFCLGASLGRHMIKAALREVYTQLPDIRVGEPEEGFSNLFNHMNRLPASWTPR